MKTQRVIGEARASFRSIFSLVLVGVLVMSAGQALGGKDIKSGVCSWPDDWDIVTSGTQGFGDLEAVDGATETIRFNGAVGTNGTRTSFKFQAPLCDFDGDGMGDTLPSDFWVPSMTCGATEVDEDGNLFGSSTTATVTWSESASTDGEIDLEGTLLDTPTEAVACTLSLDWVGSSAEDGPIEYTFNVAVVPTPHEAPTNVHAVVESYNSMYVEWDVEKATDPDTSPTSYVIEWTTSTSGASSGSSIIAEDMTLPAEGGRQGARITGLTPEGTYAVTVAGQSGSGTTTNYGRKSPNAVFGISADGDIVEFTLPKQYTGADNTFKLSTGETVEIDPQVYFMDLAVVGREIEGVLATKPLEYERYIRGTADEPVTVTSYRLTSNRFVETLYVSTDPDSQAEDIVRLKGLAEGTSNITLIATIGGVELVTSVMAVKVIENHAPRFAVTEASLSWHVDKEMALDGSHVNFEIDVMKQFGHDVTDEDQGDCTGGENENNEINCDEELTYSLGSIPGASGYVSYSNYFELERDDAGAIIGDETGVIVVKTGTTAFGNNAFISAVQRLEDGDEIGMRVTVTDVSGGKDTIDIIVEVSTEGNFPPVLAASRFNPNLHNSWLSPLSEANGGGTRTINLASKFSDPEGDPLCYEIVGAASDGTIEVGSEDGGEVWATGELGRTPGHATCNGPELSIKMVLPSSDPTAVGFKVLGKYGIETVTIKVQARERTAASPANAPTAATAVNVNVVYGTNAAPTIRNVALAGSVYHATGNYEIPEADSIKLTFTADDAQPNGDFLCWNVSRYSCRATPCTGITDRAPNYGRASGFATPDSITASSRRSSAEINNGQSHEYQLVISGTQPGWGGSPPRVITDYESNNGVFKFNVCATDLSGATASLPFEVKIKDKEETPVISRPGSGSGNQFDLFMLVGDYSQTVNVRATDGDADALTYAAACVGGCPGLKLDVDQDTGEITITPPASNLTNEGGKVTWQIEVSASDGTETVYSDPKNFTVTVKNENTAPTFASGLSGAIFDYPENKTGTVGTTIRVTEPDEGDTLVATISGSRDFTASARAVRSEPDSAGQTTLLGYDVSIRLIRAKDHEAEVNSYDFSLVVTDEYGGASDLDITVNITDVNERPTLVKDMTGAPAKIEDQNILVGVEKCIASASDIFEDPDEQDKQSGLFIEASTTRPGDASVTIKHNEHICITGHSVGSGPGRVKVTATDREDQSVSTTFRVTVEANEPPVVVGDGIPDQDVQENGRSADIDLTAHFEDGDIAYDEELMFSFEVARASVATGVLVDGQFLRIYGDSKGTTDVTVTATDQNDQSVSHTFKVEVSRNDPPVVNYDAFDDEERYIGKEYDPVDARDAFTDEGDTLTYYVSTKNSDIATAAIKYDDEGGAWVVLHLHSPGTTSVTVTVYDSVNNDASNSFDLTVLARNDPPMVANAIEDVEVEKGVSHDIPLGDVFEDEGSLDYEVKNEDENIADVFYRASENEIRIYANNTGTTTVVVVATDNIGQTASDTFDVTVVEPPPPEPTNSAPVLSGTLDDQTVTAGEPISVSIEGVFTDPDGDELTYTAESEDTDVATVDLSDLELTISGVNAGSTVFKITATDGEFNVVGEFDVEVETIPVTIGTIPNQTLEIGGEGTSLSVGEYFFDQDGDVLTYTIETSGNAASVSIAETHHHDADISMSPNTRGSTSVMVTATDPKGRSATQTFSIAVGDENLRNSGVNLLAGTARAHVSSTSAALGSRLESSRSDTGMGFSFGNIFNRYMPVADKDTVSNAATQARNDLMGFNAKKDLLDSTWNTSANKDVDFNFNLPTVDSLLTNNFSRILNGNGGIGSFSIWGTVDAQNFEGEGYDGSANSMFLGIDVQTNECWIFGVTAARNTSEGDYWWGTASQELDTTLTTIMPYFSFEPVDGKTSVWGVVGRGSGDADTTVVNANAESSDLSFSLYMLGGRREFAKAGSLQLAFRGDAAFANLDTADGNGAFDGLKAGVNRIRAGIEGSFSVDTGNGGKVTPFGELAFRNDGGDGLTGNGFEVAGGVRLDTNTITIEARGRTLATHSAEDFSESGVSLMVNINPSSEATGLSFSFTPHWGASSQNSSVIWNEAATVTATPHGNSFGVSDGMTLNSRLAYGFALNHGKYLLTPYVDVQDTGWYGKTVMIGSELTQLIAGPRTMNMKMFFNASDDSVDQVAPKLGIQALFKF